MNELWTALGAISAFVAATAATFAGIFTYRIMRSGQEQVKISHEQFAQALEAERDAQLPVLMPVAPIISLGVARQDGFGGLAQSSVTGYDANQPLARIAVMNVGAGLALNVCGVVFEPEPREDVHLSAGQYHSHRYALPLEQSTVEPNLKATPSSMMRLDGPGNVKRVDWTSGGIAVSGDTEVASGDKHYKLYAPHRPTLADTMRGTPEKVARLTFTYSDIFDRKHAAIFDLTAQMEWETIAYLRNIKQDLDELQHERLRLQMPSTLSQLPEAENTGVARETSVANADEQANSNMRRNSLNQQGL